MSSFQSGLMSITGNVTTSVSIGIPSYVKVMSGTSPTIGSANTSDWGFVPASSTPTTSSINVSNSEKKGRWLFGSATTILAGTIEIAIHNVYTSTSQSFTIKVYKIASDGTATQIGSNLTSPATATDSTNINSLNNPEVSFAAGEGIELRLTFSTSTAQVTLGDGSGLIFQVK